MEVKIPKNIPYNSYNKTSDEIILDTEYDLSLFVKSTLYLTRIINYKFSNKFNKSDYIHKSIDKKYKYDHDKTYKIDVIKKRTKKVVTTIQKYIFNSVEERNKFIEDEKAKLVVPEFLLNSFSEV